MDQLSSCYFCGDALDASLSEYPVVPAELHPRPEELGTVVLCSGCRQKLVPVVETVVAAARDASGAGEEVPRRDDGAVDGTATTDASREPDPAGSPPARDDAPATGTIDIDRVDLGTDDSGSPGQDGESATWNVGEKPDVGGSTADDGRAESGGRIDGETSTDDGVGADDGARAEDGTRAEEPTGDDDPLATGPAGDGADPRDDGQDARDPEEHSTGGVDDGQNAGEEEKRAKSSADEGTYGGGRGAGYRPEDEDDGPTMTALEYNKVIRLLQNRELPVDRAEFETVALNAYDITREEFDTILEAAVKRGLIAEEKGKIVSAK